MSAGSGENTMASRITWKQGQLTKQSVFIRWPSSTLRRERYRVTKVHSDQYRCILVCSVSRNVCSAKSRNCGSSTSFGWRL